MCFSATASFSAGALLLGLDALTLKSARRPRELPFAVILSVTVYLHLAGRRTQRSWPRFQ
nr:hypothetical protein [Rhodoferax sp.]